MTDYTGQQFGSYRLMRLLGQSNFTDVYLGEHVHLEIQAAVKVLPQRLAGINLVNFLEEARVIAHLEHPYIVRLLDYGVRDTTPFLIMDYVPNGTLRQRHPHGSVLSLARIVSYIKDIASALQYAHNEEFVHRDVRPENFFVGPYNSVLLGDFRIGLTAQGSRHQGIQAAESTVVYMAPEEILGNPCPASDQYALAIVVYEWLSGDHPFHGSFTELCAQHLYAPLPSLHEKAPEISPEAEEVVRIALSKDAQERFASIHAFALALEQTALLEAPTIPYEIGAAPLPLAPEPISAPRPTLSISESTGNRGLVPPPGVASPSHLPADFPRRLSRRTVLLGIGGVAIAGGFATWLTLTRRARVGTRIYTYRGYPAYVAAVVWSPDGQWIASGGGNSTVQVWNSATGDHLFIYSGHSDVLYAVAWSHDGKRIASGGADQTVQVWRPDQGDGLTARGGHISTYHGHSNTVNAVAWSPDGTRIASASDDNTVRVWFPANGKTALTYRGHSDAVWAVTWSPDGKRVASTSFDRTVQVWNANDGSHILIYRGHKAEVHSVAWSPDGQRIASAGFDQTVQVWDATTGRQTLSYRGHSAGVYDIAWSPDGTSIASAGADRTVQVWDASTGNKIFTYHGHTGYVYTVGWSPNGQRIASGGADKTVQVWQAT